MGPDSASKIAIMVMTSLKKPQSSWKITPACTSAAKGKGCAGRCVSKGNTRFHHWLCAFCKAATEDGLTVFDVPYAVIGTGSSRDCPLWPFNFVPVHFAVAAPEIAPATEGGKKHGHPPGTNHHRSCSSTGARAVRIAPASCCHHPRFPKYQSAWSSSADLVHRGMPRHPGLWPKDVA